MVSDLILSIFAFILFKQLKYINKEWSLFYLFMGSSAFIGGIYHGFPIIGEQFRFISWAFLSASLISAQLAAYSNVKNYLIKYLIVSKSIFMLVLTIYYVEFTIMMIDTAISMIGFIVIGNLFFLKSLSNYISYGILICLPSVLFIAFKISFNPKYLNYYDIGHYISILSLIIMSKGIKKDYYKSQQILNLKRN